MSTTGTLGTVRTHITELFKKHPKNAGYTYIRHLEKTMVVSLLSLICFVLFFVHAIFPMLFEDIADDLLLLCHTLNNKIIVHVHENKDFITIQDGKLSSMNCEELSSVNCEELR
jgi:Family of unknown function (DUF6356)